MVRFSHWWKILRGRLLPASRQSILPVSKELIQTLTGFPVGDLRLYEQALRHRSVLRNGLEETKELPSNERLEFLGDAVLGLVVAEHLYDTFPDEDEGFLTRTRSKLVNGQILARYAKNLKLGRLILMSENMAQSDGRSNATILADAMEAVIGAIYLDRGFDTARRFILDVINNTVNLENIVEQQHNYKSMLLEYVQAQGWDQPEYRLVVERGPSHQKEFTVDVMVQREALGRGVARSKKRAEQKAAAEAVSRLRDR